MNSWLFDTISEEGGGRRRRFATSDVTELQRHLRWLALVIMGGLLVMFSVIALAWSQYG